LVEHVGAEVLSNDNVPSQGLILVEFLLQHLSDHLLSVVVGEDACDV
jgi:hypothetical protein